MSDKELMKEIDQERNKKPPFSFWGLLLALFSFGWGEFILRVDGYLLSHAEPYMQKLPEWFIGWFLVMASLIKIIGVLTEIKTFKRWGIWLLGGVWCGLSVVSIAYSFGTGYPHPSWMVALLATAGCWRIAFRGDFY